MDYGARTMQKIKLYWKELTPLHKNVYRIEVLAIREATQQTGIMVTGRKYETELT